MVVPTKWKTTRPTDLCLATRAGLHHRIRGRSHSSAYLRRDRRTPLPTPSRTGERPAEQYAPRQRTHYPSHAGHQRCGRGAILPRRCPPPACRRTLPHPRHPGPTSPLHRRYRRNGHPPTARCLRPYRRHCRTRSAPCRRPHLRHHAAPSVEHRNGVFVAGGYQVAVNDIADPRRRAS